MDPKNNQSSSASMARSAGGNNGGSQMKSSNNTVMAIVAAVVVLLVVVGALAWMQMNGNATNQVKGGQYQALFLTNGQVYFGKLSNVDDKYVRMTDIYYLQVQQSVQPADKNTQPQVSLAKLGSELHGPEDAMEVNRDQVLF